MRSPLRLYPEQLHADQLHERRSGGRDHGQLQYDLHEPGHRRPEHLVRRDGAIRDPWRRPDHRTRRRYPGVCRSYGGFGLHADTHGCKPRYHRRIWQRDDRRSHQRERERHDARTRREQQLLRGRQGGNRWKQWSLGWRRRRESRRRWHGVLWRPKLQQPVHHCWRRSQQHRVDGRLRRGSRRGLLRNRGHPDHSARRRGWWRADRGVGHHHRNRFDHGQRQRRHQRRDGPEWEGRGRGRVGWLRPA